MYTIIIQECMYCNALFFAGRVYTCKPIFTVETELAIIIFFLLTLSERLPVDALCRDGASEISRDPRKKTPLNSYSDWLGLQNSPGRTSGLISTYR